MRPGIRPSRANGRRCQQRDNDGQGEVNGYSEYTRGRMRDAEQIEGRIDIVHRHIKNCDREAADNTRDFTRPVGTLPEDAKENDREERRRGKRKGPGNHLRDQRQIRQRGERGTDQNHRLADKDA